MKNPLNHPALEALDALAARLGRREPPEAQARDKGPKTLGPFEVWHHHASLRTPGERALMLRLDERR